MTWGDFHDGSLSSSLSSLPCTMGCHEGKRGQPGAEAVNTGYVCLAVVISGRNT